MIWSPIVNTGFSDVIGSWKIIAISPPRSSLRRFFGIARRSSPLYGAPPLAIRPGGIGMRPSSVIIETLLPEPDSPTIPSISPG